MAHLSLTRQRVGYPTCMTVDHVEGGGGRGRQRRKLKFFTSEDLAEMLIMNIECMLTQQSHDMWAMGSSQTLLSVANIKSPVMNIITFKSMTSSTLFMHAYTRLCIVTIKGVTQP